VQKFVEDCQHSSVTVFCHSRVLPMNCHVQKWLNSKCLLMNYWGTHPHQQANHCGKWSSLVDATSGKWQLNGEGHLSHHGHREVQCSQLGMHLAVGQVTENILWQFWLALVCYNKKTWNPSLRILTRKT
jgi:hypothetical protein